MNRFLKIVWLAVFLAFISAPMLYFFGAKETWTSVFGVESKAEMPSFTFRGFSSRDYQSRLTECYSKKFFLRATFLRTAYQLREYMNFGQFHYGYGNSILEGRGGIIYERPYADYHLRCSRPGGREKYAEAMKIVADMNEFCRTNDIFFVFLTMPDKLQAYPEYLPRWLDWFFDYSNYNPQRELAQIFVEADIPVLDANEYLMAKKREWENWLYPPGGTHFSAYGIGLVYEGFVERFVKTGMIDLKTSRFAGVRKIDHPWRDEDDISNLMNLWKNSHIENNPHFEPIYDYGTNDVLNAGSMITLGDCYAGTVAQAFGDAKIFDKCKIKVAPRCNKPQKSSEYAGVAKDLRLIILCFQSFNTGRFDERRDELNYIFTAIKGAVK